GQALGIELPSARSYLIEGVNAVRRNAVARSRGARAVRTSPLTAPGRRVQPGALADPRRPRRGRLGASSLPARPEILWRVPRQRRPRLDARDRPQRLLHLARAEAVARPRDVLRRGTPRRRIRHQRPRGAVATRGSSEAGPQGGGRPAPGPPRGRRPPR